MAVPGKLHYSPDATFISYLFSERGDLARDLWRLDLATGKKEHWLSPAGVWAVDEGGERRLTSHPPNATSGLAEFVAQEELDRLSGYWPSPSGEQVAFEQVDESNIPTYPIVHQAKAKVEIEEHRYPFTGAENARVKLGLLQARDGAAQWLDPSAEDGY